MKGLVAAFRKTPEYWVFALVLVYLGTLLSVTVIPGVFTSDENNYLSTVVALRDGGLTVANTEGLPASRELLSFDALPRARRSVSTPVATIAPPLYAPIALPVLALGWRGLVGINTVCYLLTTVLVFAWTRRFTEAKAPAWLAAGAFALGAYTIEYAQGLWPHMLSVALCTGGIAAAARVVDGTRPSLAPAAGLLIGVAAGIRYQNAAILAAVAGCIAWWARPRLRALLAYSLGAAIPLALSSTANYLRLGSWNPVSKGEGYLALQVVQESSRPVLDAVVMTWARVVDFAARPPYVGPATEHWLAYEPTTGSHILIAYVLKKALLQSAPWAILGFALLASAWFSRRIAHDARRRHLQLISVVVLTVIAVFALAGPRRHDGLAFNERYLLELLPLLAVSFGWALATVRLSWRQLLAGAAAGGAGAMLILLGTPVVGGPQDSAWLARQFLILRVPLVGALLLVSFWMLTRRERLAHAFVAVGTGACLAWGLGLHVLTDLDGSRRTRSFHAARTQALDRLLPDHSALVAYYWQKESAVPLIMTRDIVVVNPWVDEGEDTPQLMDALLQRGRRVFVLRETMPPAVLERLLRDRSTRSVPCCSAFNISFVEIVDR